MSENTAAKGAQSAETQPEANGSTQQTERTFTQEEVNKIVSDRLARERSKAAEPTPEEAQRLADLKAREEKMACMDYLKAKNYPEKMTEVFDTSDSATFKKNVEKLLEAFPMINEPIRNPAPVGRTTPPHGVDMLASIFRSKI